MLAQIFQKNEIKSKEETLNEYMGFVRPVCLVKEYRESSILCSDARLIGMVKRLRVDSNKDACRYLRHVHLAEEPMTPEKESREH